MNAPFKKKMLVTLVAVAILMSGCAGLSVPDMLIKLDELTLQCRGAVSKLEANGVVAVKAEECDKAAGQARGELKKLLDDLRAQLVKAGV